MKTIYYFFFLISTISYSQELKKGEKIKLKTPVEIQKNKTVFVNNPKNSEVATHLDDNIIFKVVNTSNDYVDLIALNFKDGSDNAKLYNDKIYRVDKSKLSDNFNNYEPQDRVSLGIITLPFKYRPQKNETFETEFNLNTTLNIRIFELGKNAVYLQGGTGFGSIKLDTTNSTVDAESSINAITLSGMLGIMSQYKNVQFGIYSGTDIINNQSKYNWIHNGKLWFGLGIGYNLFKISINDQQKEQ